MNDVTRQVAGALGTAVIGSIISSVYASRVAGSVASLPDASRAAAALCALVGALVARRWLPARHGARPATVVAVDARAIPEGAV